MSKEIMETVIGKAILEEEFRAALLADPDQTLVDFQLTLAEKACLKRMDCDTMEALARALNVPPHREAAGTVS